MVDYETKFILFASPLSHVAMQVMLSNFSKGLEPKLSTKLKL